MENRGRYLYGVALSERPAKLGPIGIEGNEVYLIPYQRLGAIVHDCPAEPYQSTKEEIVANWVRDHQKVLDEAKKQLGAVIPVGFDTILKSRDDTVSPEQVVKDWLRADYERLQFLMEKIKNRDEYAVQVFYEPGVIAGKITEQSQEIRTIAEGIAARSPGVAYLQRQKLERVVRAEMERLANGWFQDFYARIKSHCVDIVVEKPKKAAGNKVMLLNLSCLVAGDHVDGLGEELEKITRQKGFSVHFSGPWPPYTFVAKPAIPVEGGVQ